MFWELSNQYFAAYINFCMQKVSDGVKKAIPFLNQYNQRKIRMDLNGRSLILQKKRHLIVWAKIYTGIIHKNVINDFKERFYGIYPTHGHAF